MDWTHALVAFVSATIGGVAHKMYAYYTRRSYWSDISLALRHGSRRKHTTRSRPRRGYTVYYGHARNLDPFFD